MRNNKLLKSVLSLVLVVAMVLGTVTTSYAEEVETTEVTVEEVVEAIENAEEQMSDVVASVTFGDEQVDIVTENAIDELVKADEIIKVADQIIEDAAAEVEDALNGTEGINEDVAETDKEIADASATLEENVEALDKIVEESEDKYGDAENMTFESSEDAKAVVDSLTTAQAEAKAAYEKAADEAKVAGEKLAAAQAEYEAAVLVSEEAAKEAAAKLEVAKAELAVAEEVAKTANESVIKIQGILDNATGYMEEQKANAEEALADAEAKLQESQESLDVAVEKLQTEDEEFNAALADFQKKYTEFVEKANEFYGAIKNAQTTEEELEALYAEYEKVLEAYEVALAADVDGSLTDKDAKALEKVLESATEARDTALAQKEFYDNNVAYEEQLREAKNKFETADAESKDEKAKELGLVVLQEKLVNGETAEWISAEKAKELGLGTPAGEGFYVVYKDGKAIGFYDYAVTESDADNDGEKEYAVDVYSLVTNSVQYGDTTYSVKTDDQGQYIMVGEKRVAVETHDNGNYYIKEDAQYEEKEIVTEIESVTDSNGKVHKVIDLSDYGTDARGYVAIEGSGWNARTYVYVYVGEVNGEHKFDKYLVSVSWSSGIQLTAQNVSASYTTDNMSYDADIAKVVTFEGKEYTLQEIDGNYYISNILTGVNERVFLNADGTYYFEQDLTKVTSGADAIYERGNAYNNSNAYQTNKQNAITNYNNAQSAYEAADADFKVVSAFEEKDLGAMAELPKNIGEMVEGLTTEQLATLLESIVKISSGENVNYLDLLGVVGDITSVDALERLTEVKVDFLGVRTTEFERQYADAWINALLAKIEVVNAAVEVVDATSATISSGLETIVAGEELGNAAIDALLAKIEKEILSGAVASVTIAADIVGAADEVVVAISEKVDALQRETQEAYDAVVAAQKALDELELTNPKAEELADAKSALDEANRNYELLVEQLDDAETSLANAEKYREAAQKQFESLYAEETKPAEGDTPELPTPDVTPDVEEETTVGGVIDAAGTVEEIEEILETVTFEEVEIEDEETPLAGGEEETIVIEDEETPLANGEETVIEDEETPLAAEEASNMVVPVAVATGSVSILALLWFFLRKKVAA